MILFNYFIFSTKLGDEAPLDKPDQFILDLSGISFFNDRKNCQIDERDQVGETWSSVFSYFLCSF